MCLYECFTSNHFISKVLPKSHRTFSACEPSTTKAPLLRETCSQRHASHPPVITINRWYVYHSQKGPLFSYFNHTMHVCLIIRLRPNPWVNHNSHIFSLSKESSWGYTVPVHFGLESLAQYSG